MNSFAGEPKIELATHFMDVSRSNRRVSVLAFRHHSPLPWDWFISPEGGGVPELSSEDLGNWPNKARIP